MRIVATVKQTGGRPKGARGRLRWEVFLRFLFERGRACGVRGLATIARPTGSSLDPSRVIEYLANQGSEAKLTEQRKSQSLV